jgi:hypothetical protein
MVRFQHSQVGSRHRERKPKKPSRPGQAGGQLDFSDLGAKRVGQLNLLPSRTLPSRRNTFGVAGWSKTPWIRSVRSIRERVE